MSSTAISAQGSTLKISTGSGGALNITAVALTNPARITLASVTGLAKGDVVAISGIVGTTQLNGVNAVVQYIEPTSKIVTLANIDATGYTAYTSGGTATPQTYTQIANLKDFSGMDGKASEIDITNLDSTAKEVLMGITDPGSLTFSIDRDFSDAGQIAMETAHFTRTLKTFKLTLPNAKVATFNGYVTSWPLAGGTDALLKTSCTLRITGAIAWA